MGGLELLRWVDLVFYGEVHSGLAGAGLFGQQDRHVVAAAAPLGGLGAGDLLEVLDGLAVPLVIERPETVRGGEPLLVDIRMAPGFSARFVVGEVFRRKELIA